MEEDELQIGGSQKSNNSQQQPGWQPARLNGDIEQDQAQGTPQSDNNLQQQQQQPQQPQQPQQQFRSNSVANSAELYVQDNDRQTAAIFDLKPLAQHQNQQAQSAGGTQQHSNNSTFTGGGVLGAPRGGAAGTGTRFRSVGNAQRSVHRVPEGVGAPQTAGGPLTLNGAGRDVATEESDPNWFVMLGDYKKQRKQAEVEAQILANRIALLKQEELKSWKKIQETKRKTDEILRLKKLHETRQEMKEGQRREIAEIQRARQNNGLEMRHKKREQMQHLRDALVRNKHEEYIKIKRQEDENSRRREYYMSMLQNENRMKHTQIRNIEVSSVQKVVEYKRHNKRIVEDQYKMEIDLELAQRKKREEEIREMEQLELELLKKLHNTQLLQKTAFEELEGVLNMKASQFEEKFRQSQGNGNGGGTIRQLGSKSIGSTLPVREEEIMSAPSPNLPRNTEGTAQEGPAENNTRYARIDDNDEEYDEGELGPADQGVGASTNGQRKLKKKKKKRKVKLEKLERPVRDFIF